MMKTLRTRTGLVGALAATAALFGTLLAPVAAHAGSRGNPRGHVPAELAVGYVYATFDQDPNLVMLVGGDARAFCLNNPEDPFNAEPGEASHRLFFRRSGAVDVKANAKDQPISLYQLPNGAIPPLWLEEICDDVATVPDAFASGAADLKVRISDRGSVVDVFNSVNGRVQTADGTEYKVRASADLVVKDDVPQGDPADFVSLELTEIRR